MQPNAVQEVIMTFNFWILELFDANNRDLIVFKFFPLMADFGFKKIAEVRYLVILHISL